MRMLSRKDIEGIAARVFAAYKKLPDLQGKPIYRIEPEKLVRDVLGLNIEFHHLSRYGSVLGVTSPCEVSFKVYDDADQESYALLDGNTIFVEQNLKSDIKRAGRCNFTIAHEASHQIFKMLYPKEYGADPHQPKVHFYLANSEVKKPIKDWEEWQANTLGAAILMQEDLVRQSLFLFGLPESGIQMLNRVYRSAVYERFADMASFLDVSKKALSIRLRQLGLLEKDFLDNPYALTDILYYCGGE